MNALDCGDTVRKYEAKVNGGGCLELNLQQLMSNIRELAVVLVVLISKTLTHQSMKGGAAVAILSYADIGEAVANEWR